MRKLLILAGSALLAIPAFAAERSYAVDGAASSVHVQVGKSGIFKFAGHEHDIVARRLSGTVVADEDNIEHSSVKLEFDARSLQVSGDGEPSADVPKVQEIMLGPTVLDSARFATITFESQKVSGRKQGSGYEITVNGEVKLHGVARSISVPLKVELTADTLTASGQLSLRQSDFGIEPTSAGGGTVKVKDEIPVNLKIVARSTPR